MSMVSKGERVGPMSGIRGEEGIGHNVTWAMKTLHSGNFVVEW